MRTHSITFYDLNDPKPEVNRMIQMRLKSSPDKWETYGIWNGKSFRDQNNRLRLDVVEWFYDDEQYPKPDDDEDAKKPEGHDCLPGESLPV